MSKRRLPIGIQTFRKIRESEPTGEPLPTSSRNIDRVQRTRYNRILSA